jgi:hypothetical protein
MSPAADLPPLMRPVVHPVSGLLFDAESFTHAAIALQWGFLARPTLPGENSQKLVFIIT